MGAWIETPRLDSDNLATLVAPRVGAWIETLSKKDDKTLVLSHPVWVRGLKLLIMLSKLSL